MLVRRRPQTVMGHAIARPRLTARAALMLAWRLALPVLALGGLIDLAMQLVFGVCTGLWCLAG